MKKKKTVIIQCSFRCGCATFVCLSHWRKVTEDQTELSINTSVFLILSVLKLSVKAVNKVLSLHTVVWDQQRYLQYPGEEVQMMLLSIIKPQFKTLLQLIMHAHFIIYLQNANPPLNKYKPFQNKPFSSSLPLSLSVSHLSLTRNAISLKYMGNRLYSFFFF